MSINLRWKDCCSAFPNHVRCMRPATRPGHHCARCWMALSPGERAAFEVMDRFRPPPRVVVEVEPEPVTVKTRAELAEEFESFYNGEWENTREPREVLKLYADLARFEAGT